MASLNARIILGVDLDEDYGIDVVLKVRDESTSRTILVFRVRDITCGDEVISIGKYDHTTLTEMVNDIDVILREIESLDIETIVNTEDSIIFWRGSDVIGTARGGVTNEFFD